MPEPLFEDVERNWLLFMKRFDTEIYPVLFAKFGYSKDTALIVWQLTNVLDSIDTLTEKLEESQH